MSKIGGQSQNGTLQDFDQVLAKLPIAWLLLGQAANVDLAQKIKRLSPQTILLLRAQADDWALDDSFTADFIQRSIAFAAPFLKAGLVFKLMAPNEPVVRNVAEAQQLNKLMIRVAEAYKAAGHEPIAYNFSVGNPPYELWPYLEGGISACGGWLSLHQYGAPTLQSYSADLSLRHRNVLKLLTPSVAKTVKIVITECGLDFGIGNPRVLPDGYPTSGGYRALPARGDDAMYWINNYLDQLMGWWDGELMKDPQVVAATPFLYGGLQPWVGLGFDFASIDTDRKEFIRRLKPGVYVPPANGGGPVAQPTPAQVVATVPFLVKASLKPAWGPGGLGQPVYGQYVVNPDTPDPWWAWIFLRGGLMISQHDDYTSLDHAKLFNPIDGTPLAEPLPWPSGGVPVPPPLSKRQTTSDMPQGYGFSVESYVPKAGEQFWGLVNNGAWKLGQGTQILVETLGLAGTTIFGIPVTHAYDPALIKNETFLTDGTGQAHFIEGHGNDFTPPAPPPDQFYISANDGVDGSKWPTRKGDVVHMGQVGGHTEGTLVFQLMVG